MISSACLDSSAMRLLLADTVAPEDRVALELHLAHCTDCQKRLEEMASGGEALTRACRQCHTTSAPPRAAAYWPALADLQREVITLLSPEEGAPSKDVRLDFLSASDNPGSLGRLGHFDV